MNAEIVWNVWRRILCDDALQAALFAPDFAVSAAAFGLTEEERAIAVAYARTPTETRWSIDTYRFRSFNVIVEALYVAAPLTARLLERRGFDLDVLARDYLSTVAWRDEGPYTYRTCAGVLAFVDRTLAGPRDLELGELVAFEAATVALMQSLAGQDLAAPGSSDADATDDPQARWARSRRGVTLTTHLDLTPWLNEPDTIARLPLSPKELTFLRYIRSSQEEPALLALRDRALRTFELVASPRGAGEIAEIVGDETPDRVIAILRRFVNIGVVQLFKE